MVVAQLAKRLLPIPEVRGSNPNIGKVLLNFFTVKGIEKTKIKKKRQGVAHLKNISCFQYSAGDNRFPLKIIVFCFHSLS